MGAIFPAKGVPALGILGVPSLGILGVPSLGILVVLFLASYPPLLTRLLFGMLLVSGDIPIFSIVLLPSSDPALPHSSLVWAGAVQGPYIDNRRPPPFVPG